MKALDSILLALALAPSAAAQLVPIYVTDIGLDPSDTHPVGVPERIWRCADLNADGDFDDPSEIVAFYDEDSGPFALRLNQRIVSRPDGTVFVIDRDVDRIFAFRDENADGDANDAGESRVFFDGSPGGNASGVLMDGGNAIEFDPANGVWYVANSDVNGENDSIVRLVDLNGDRDANDAGEASEYLTLFDLPGTDSAHPRAVAIGPDARVYYLDTDNILPSATGIYRLVDVNMDGDANDPGERTAYFVPPSGTSLFLWSLRSGIDGWFYTAETHGDVVWRFRDLNADGDAQDPGESSAWWTVGGPSFIQDFAVAPDGSLYAIEFSPTQRIERVYDANHDGVIGAGEVTVVHGPSPGGAEFAAPAGIDVARAATTATPFCFGDGTGVACPCGNASAAGNREGCLHSLGTGGALSATGSASVSNDTLVLRGSRMPNSPALYVQGSAFVSGGAGTAFGDGLRCVGGTIHRLGFVQNVAGASSYPGPGDASIFVRGQDAPGDARVYQVWYRNAASFCTPSTFNLTNGLTLTWMP